MLLTIYDSLRDNSYGSNSKEKFGGNILWCFFFKTVVAKAEFLKRQFPSGHLSGFSVHGIFQARLEWVVISFSRGSSRPRDRTQISHIAADTLPFEPPGKPLRTSQFSSVAQSCPTLCDPINRSMPGLPAHHQLPESLRLTSIKSVMSSSHLILCRPLLLLPPIPPSIRVFSNESTLHMRWPKHWSFSLSIIPSR